MGKKNGPYTPGKKGKKKLKKGSPPKIHATKGREEKMTFNIDVTCRKKGKKKKIPNAKGGHRRRARVSGEKLDGERKRGPELPR